MTGNQPETTAAKKKWDELKRRRLSLLAYHRISLAQIAREMGRAAGTVSTVVHRFPEKRSQAIQDYIAIRLNAPYERLWGPDLRHTPDHHTSKNSTGKKERP